MEKIFLTIFLLSSLVAVVVQGHGYLLNPPARGTAWRMGFKTPADHNDMGNYCGGKGPQHNQNKGKCAVCGESYSKTNKVLEPGPANKFATGTILGDYTQGRTIDVTIMITAYHKGYYEFRLCENNVPQKGKDPSIAITNECLAKNLLESPSGSTKFPASPGKSTHKVQLPAHITCTACVFQWRYRTANNWGCEGGKCGSGLGPQEEFVGCSDIAIRPSDGVQVKTTPEVTTLKPTTKSPTTMKQIQQDTTTMKPKEIKTTVPSIPDTTTMLQVKSSTTMKPKVPSTPRATTKPTVRPTPHATTKPTVRPTPRATTKPTVRPTPRATIKPTARPTPPPRKNPTGKKMCRGSRFYGARFDHYCKINCNHIPPYCPPSHCKCV